MKSLNELRRDRSGQGLAEYALIIGIVAVGVLAAMTVYRDEVRGVFRTTEAAVAAATAQDAGTGTTTPTDPPATDPGNGNPGNGNPGNGNPGNGNPGNGNPGAGNPGNGNPKKP